LKIENKEVDQLRQLMEETATEKAAAKEEQRQTELRREAERAVRQREEYERQQEALLAAERRRAEETRAAEQSRLELEQQRERLQRKEEADRQAAAKQQIQQEDAMVRDFLEKQGFTDINEIRKIPSGFMRTRKCSPLHLAVEHNDAHLVRLLVARGADLQAKTGKGKRPYDLAKGLGQENPDSQDLLELLQPK
jgi:hypothetical protein